MDTRDFQELERVARDEIVEAIEIVLVKAGDESAIFEIQPSASVVYAMAQAAASVLIAFERGYQLNSDE